MKNLNSQNKSEIPFSPPNGAKKSFSSTPLLQANKTFSKDNSINLTKGKFNSQSPKTGKILKPTKFNKTNKTFANSKSTNIGLKIKRVLSLSQILGRIRQQRQKKLEQQKRQKPIKPIIPPKSLIIVLKDKPEKAVYNRRIIDYKHCGLLQRYIGLGGKILPRRQTRLTAKQQRYVAKTIKSARIMGLLPFVSKERGFFR
uniref:Small ribosomal subunit protein bS18c n=1 Tax=Chloromonas radiata TaxID=47907 RepID=A0A0S2ICK8_9CHLO|nr:ribosomal protein S18 [Chloromonas radiata]